MRTYNLTLSMTDDCEAADISIALHNAVHNVLWRMEHEMLALPELDQEIVLQPSVATCEQVSFNRTE